MAGASFERCLRRFGRGRVERGVAEELRLHCEMLVEECRGRGLDEREARAAAAERFGDFESAFARCVEVGKRNRPAAKLLRLSLPLLLTAGVWLRVCAAGIEVAKLGDVMMATAVLAHLLQRSRRLGANAAVIVSEDSPRTR